MNSFLLKIIWHFNFFLDFLSLFLVRYIPIAKKGNKTLVLLKFDAAGDYLISRNLIQKTFQYAKSKEFDFLLIGSKAFCNAGKELDNFKVCIINNSDFDKGLKQLKLFFKLKRINAGLLLHPTLHAHRNAHLVAKGIRADMKISFSISYFRKNYNYYNKWIKKLYNREIDGLKYEHEFYIQRNFYERSLNINFDVESPVFLIRHENRKKHIIICPGASSSKKEWPVDKYIDLAKMILNRFEDYRLIFIPGNDLRWKNFDYRFEGEVEIIRQKNLNEIIEIIAASSFVIGNDSLFVHIAACTLTPFLCIFDGSLFGRFVPYPQSMGVKSYFVIPNNMVKKLNIDFQILYESYGRLPINTISLDDVWHTFTQKFINQCVKK
jgi:ADP-heptose:LPS heptosyltransferase